MGTVARKDFKLKKSRTIGDAKQAKKSLTRGAGKPSGSRARNKTSRAK